MHNVIDVSIQNKNMNRSVLLPDLDSVNLAQVQQKTDFVVMLCTALKTQSSNKKAKS
jgi:hypothetical protein